MMDASNRLVRRLAELSASGRKGLLPYVTAGFPDLPTTRGILEALDRAGVAAVELGFPYSDPIADGPVIQESFTRALAAGIHVRDILAMVREFRSMSELPLLGMLSYSIVYRIGPERFAAQAREAGLDGLILPDLSLEEAAAVVPMINAAGLCVPMLVSPISPPQRRKQIAALSSGFVYYMSVTGITGERTALPPELVDNVRELRAAAGLPVVVGFGISTAEQVRMVCQVADGAIIGSALVRRMIHAADTAGPQAIVPAAEAAVREWMEGVGSRQ